jgi:hypothetical protein
MFARVAFRRSAIAAPVSARRLNNPLGPILKVVTYPLQVATQAMVNRHMTKLRKQYEHFVELPEGSRQGAFFYRKFGFCVYCFCLQL